MLADAHYINESTCSLPFDHPIPLVTPTEEFEIHITDWTKQCLLNVLTFGGALHDLIDSLISEYTTFDNSV